MAKIMERRYICRNGIIEKTRFVVGDNTAAHPRWRKAKSSQDKREENQRQAIRELARIFNCNCDETGFFVKLDYSPESWHQLFDGMDEDQILREAKHQGGLCMRRLKRQVGLELKFAYIASDRDLVEGELLPCRIHNHLVIMGATEEQIRESWTLGRCTHIERLYRMDDYTRLAAYMLLQVRTIPGYKKYTTSRNMEKPKVEERVVVGDPSDEIRVQPGAKVLDRSPRPEGTVVQYVRYKRKPVKKRHGGHIGNTDPPVPQFKQDETGQLVLF